MNKKILSISTKISIKLLSGCMLTLMFANTVIAAYTPPKKPSRPPGPVASGGTRTGACSTTSQASLTALAPISHVGKTASQQPTFAWFVPDSKSYPMEFTLYEYKSNGKPEEIKSIKFSSKPGIMKLSLAKNQLNLSVGKKYRWQIALLCDPNNPSKDLTAEAELEIAPIPNNLALQIQQAQNSIQKAQIYAREGFWYDGLAETLKSSQNQQFKLTLLEKLSDLEAKAAINLSDNSKEDFDSKRFKTSLQNQASQLQKIIQIEQY
ncbi:hypothetical protein NIES267_09710 [Calothrix parasitica NIES-267]|uniref:DUF928 domain-containing protein n=1 Tax=Calothrix parasitica NIES-267 TaxID=1973488 RepID=A0A1Z4LJX5_9CYAN|nr:hypothetical protein NIES267_09710 [Calothrix parasitica NIES-267]